jgi:hypothetical protein
MRNRLQWRSLCNGVRIFEEAGNRVYFRGINRLPTKRILAN